MKFRKICRRLDRILTAGVILGASSVASHAASGSLSRPATRTELHAAQLREFFNSPTVGLTQLQPLESILTRFADPQRKDQIIPMTSQLTRSAQEIAKAASASNLLEMAPADREALALKLGLLARPEEANKYPSSTSFSPHLQKKDAADKVGIAVKKLEQAGYAGVMLAAQRVMQKIVEGTLITPEFELDYPASGHHSLGEYADGMRVMANMTGQPVRGKALGADFHVLPRAERDELIQGLHRAVSNSGQYLAVFYGSKNSGTNYNIPTPGAQLTSPNGKSTGFIGVYSNVDFAQRAAIEHLASFPDIGQGVQWFLKPHSIVGLIDYLSFEKGKEYDKFRIFPVTINRVP